MSQIIPTIKVSYLDPFYIFNVQMTQRLDLYAESFGRAAALDFKPDVIYWSSRYISSTDIYEIFWHINVIYWQLMLYTDDRHAICYLLTSMCYLQMICWHMMLSTDDMLTTDIIYWLQASKLMQNTMQWNYPLNLKSFVHWSSSLL